MDQIKSYRKSLASWLRTKWQRKFCTISKWRNVIEFLMNKYLRRLIVIKRGSQMNSVARQHSLLLLNQWPRLPAFFFTHSLNISHKMRAFNMIWSNAVIILTSLQSQRNCMILFDACVCVCVWTAHWQEKGISKTLNLVMHKLVQQN